MLLQDIVLRSHLRHSRSNRQSLAPVNSRFLPSSVVNVFLKYRSNDDWPKSKDTIIQCNVAKYIIYFVLFFFSLQIIENTLTRILVVECEEELWNSEDNVLVEEVQDHFSYPDIVQSSMIQYQLP